MSEGGATEEARRALRDATEHFAHVLADDLVTQLESQGFRRGRETYNYERLVSAIEDCLRG